MLSGLFDFAGDGIDYYDWSLQRLGIGDYLAGAAGAFGGLSVPDGCHGVCILNNSHAILKIGFMRREIFLGSSKFDG